MKTFKEYDIVRFSQTKRPKVVKRGLSLLKAQEHCQKDDTKGKTWFDGYSESGRY